MKKRVCSLLLSHLTKSDDLEMDCRLLVIGSLVVVLHPGDLHVVKDIICNNSTTWKEREEE